jgi:hypothetical protein
MAFFAMSVTNAIEALIIQQMIKQYVQMRVSKLKYVQLYKSKYNYFMETHISSLILIFLSANAKNILQKYSCN